MIAVTGAGGFVGRHLVAALLYEGKPVRAVVRSMAGAAEMREQGAQVVTVDLFNRTSLRLAFRDCDTIIHLISTLGSQGDTSPDQINRLGTELAVMAAEETGAQQIIYLSALGAAPDTDNEYLQSKWGAEEVIRSSPVGHYIFRCSYIVGPRGGIVNLLGTQAKLPVAPVIGDGKQTISPVYLGDVVEAIIAGIKNPQARETFDLCGPDCVSFDQFLDMIATAQGRRRGPRKIHVPAGAVGPLIGLAERFHPAPPVTSSAIQALLSGNTGDSRPIAEAMGLHLTSLEFALQASFGGAH